MKRLGWILILMVVAVSGMTQGFSRQSADRKFYFGGGGGFGSGVSGGIKYNYYSIFPIIGYRITPQFSAGTGFNYQHYGYPDYGIKQEQYGFSPFLRYNFDKLFFQTEFDIINSPAYINTASTDPGRRIYNRWLFGVGYSIPLGQKGRTAINAMAMYDILYKQPSVFNSPIVARVFVTF